MSERCPTCQSPSPHLHPAMQHEGEVELCTDEFHLTPTNQNTVANIASVNAKRRERALAKAYAPLPNDACNRCGEPFEFGDQVAYCDGVQVCMPCFESHFADRAGCDA